MAHQLFLNCGVITLTLFLLNTAIKAGQTVKIGILVDKSRSSPTVKQTVLKAFDAMAKKKLGPNITVEFFYDLTSNQISAFENIQSVCKMVERGVSLIVGPGYSSAVSTSYPVCAGMHIPQITPTASDSELFVESDEYEFLFKLNAPVNVQTRVIVDIIRHYGWQRMAFLAAYTRYARHNFDEFNKHASYNNWSISTVQFFDPFFNASSINITEQLLTIKRKGARVVVLSCEAVQARVVLDQAFSYGMLTDRWAWIISDGDSSINGIFDPCTDPPIYLRGLIGIRTTRREDSIYDNISQQISSSISSHTDAHINGIYDAMMVALSGLAAYVSAGHSVTDDSPVIGVCSSTNATYRKDGALLRQFILNISNEDGSPVFTEYGHPPFYKFDVLNLQESGWRKVGDWSDKRAKALELRDSLVIFPGQTDTIPDDTADQLRTLTLEVVTILEEPFVMRRTLRERAYKRDVMYKGYCVELLNLLQEALGFSYRIHLVADEKYGSEDPVTGKWNGLVGEIIRGDADMAVAPLTISYEREQHVDFTKPFFDLGLGVLVAKQSPTSHLLGFLEPFQWDLWMGVLASFLVCGIAVTYCSYVSPFGFYGRYAQRLDVNDHRYKEQSKVLNVIDNLWYTYASWQTQGPEVTSRCLSGRVIHGAWWVFVTVISATYTANLAAFLTVDSIQSGITSIFDLAEQTDIAYGTAESSAPAAFFATQQGAPYRQMYEYMKNHNTFVPNSTTGINRVRNSYGASKESGKQYAFIFDSAPLEYAAVNAPCKTAMIGKLFNNFGYGIAFRKNSPYRDIFSLQILKLRQRGELGSLRSKWFTGTCLGNSERQINTRRQSLSGMAGIFAFLGLGIAFGLLIVIFEICFVIHKDCNQKDLHWSRSFGKIYRRIREDAINRFFCLCLTTKEDFNVQRNTKQHVKEIGEPEVEIPPSVDRECEVTGL